jgi:hypothetical protein
MQSESASGIKHSEWNLLPRRARLFLLRHFPPGSTSLPPAELRNRRFWDFRRVFRDSPFVQTPLRLSEIALLETNSAWQWWKRLNSQARWKIVEDVKKERRTAAQEMEDIEQQGIAESKKARKRAEDRLRVQKV